MIVKLCGKAVASSNNSLTVDVGGIHYEVFIPATVMQRLEETVLPEGPVSLITYHYHQIDMNRSTPVLIGFLNQIEKEFFEIFITVSGIGPRGALKALNQPISLIAKAIDEGDVTFLKTLPGIGQQRAREIVAKLQNKVGKFGLLRDGLHKESVLKKTDIEEEAIEVLMQLEYKKPEAQAMIRKAYEGSPDIETVEGLLNQVYKQRKGN